jgi:hypothetical protein
MYIPLVILHTNILGGVRMTLTSTPRHHISGAAAGDPGRVGQKGAARRGHAPYVASLIGLAKALVKMMVIRRDFFLLAQV